MTTSMEAREQLREVFGFEAFREGQEEIVQAVMDGRDVLAVMPTGAGKSLCYQLPGTLLPGLTVVVSPLIALMKDQVDALEARGVKAAFINSSLSEGEREARLTEVLAGRTRILYLAPERFRAAGFLERLAGVPISLLAIDEAHCISQWGHQFRPDYTRLGEAREQLQPERIAGFTATATREVREDIARELRLLEPLVAVHGFDRPELFFGAEQLAGKKLKAARVLHHLQEMRGEHGDAGSAIVYCATRKHTEAITELLQSEGLTAIAYHAGLGDAEREAAQEAFMRGEARIVVATNAFGMGVDKADIRLVLHHDLPGSVEAYYQEAGRAGRDGLPAKAILLWGLGDLRLRRFFIELGTPTPADVQKIWERLRGSDDESRVGKVTAGPTARLAKVAGVEAGTVPVVLRLLETAGHLRREEASDGSDLGDADDRDGHLRVRILDDAPVSALRVDLQALARHRNLEEARLERMVTYAGRSLCRRRALLDYFGDPAGPPPGTLCGACDACEEAQARGASSVEISEGARERVRGALSMIDASEMRFGRRKLAAALSGVEAPGLERTPLPRHPSAGSFEALGEEAAAVVLDRCVGSALLRVDRDPYPVLAITAGGRAVLEGHAPVPDEVASLADLALVSAKQARDRAAKKAVGMRLRKKKAPSEEALGPVNEPLYEALRELRARLAREQNVPAYVILHDKHLKALAAMHPKTEDALLEVPGMGPKRVEKYGATLLEILGEH